MLYSFLIHISSFALKGIACFNNKIKLGVEGRKESFSKIQDKLNNNPKTLWFHCASLGEYEQGLPVFKALRKKYQSHTIILTFFSPSGYEIRKNTPIADIVVYLPLDTKQNAKRFFDLVKPELTVFVKYDIWPNFLLELKQRQLRAILISAVFRKNQPYFKFYGSKLRKALTAFEHIFVQEAKSKKLIETIGFKNVSISGDTRFDRVHSQLKTDNTLDFVNEFKNNKLCIVIGSSWPEDEILWIEFINTNTHKDVKYIIAPHNIKTNEIGNLTSKLNSKTILFSKKEGKKLSDYNVMIVDTIGLLSKIYSYGDIAYVGGAMGNTGLHNILEPAVFGIPIIIGKHHKKFPEAQAMIEHGGVISISNFKSLNTEVNKLIKDNHLRLKTGELNKKFIKKNTGAVIQIMDYLRK